MALRVPKAALPAELKETLIRQLGALPEPVEVLYSNPEVAVSNQEFTARCLAGGNRRCSARLSGTCWTTPRS
jgi:hypothetical protein